MKHQYIIYDRYLVMRPITYEDIEKVRIWRNKDSIRKWFIHENIVSKKEQENWFKGYLSNENDVMFIVEWNNTPIGTAALYDINYGMQTAQFGRFMIGEPQAKGLGIGKKAAKALCEFGLNELGLKKIELEVLSDNRNAIHIYEDIGFIKKDEMVIDGKKLYKMDLSK